MCSLETMLKRVEYVKENIVSITTSLLNETQIEFDICELNRKQLYDFGVNSKNIPLLPYKSSIYAEMKFNLSGHDFTDLFLTSEFQRGFYIIILPPNRYGIYSTDEKTGELVLKYGEDIFGLTDQNKELAYFVLRPRLVEVVQSILTP